MQKISEKIHPRLPIFRFNNNKRAILYTPGYLTAMSHSDAEYVQRFFYDKVNPNDQNLNSLSNTFVKYAEQTAENWNKLSEAPFEPECLTVYLSNYCNLQCAYCYSTQDERTELDIRQKKRTSFHSETIALIVKEDFVRVAAYAVSKNCVKKQKPFRLVLHGGGEPTIHWGLVKRIVLLTKQIANDFGIGWWGYIATHGAISEEIAAGIAQIFNMIGLSCDGPPDIQNIQRPMINGRKKTANILERTARIFQEQGAKFVVRVTITPQTVKRQSEIVQYCCSILGATEIRIEPVYASKPGFKQEDSEMFVHYFLEAQALANTLQCKLHISGVRLEEIHGPYCNVFRDVLQLTPDGSITSCFLCTTSQGPKGELLSIGHVDLVNNTVIINKESISSIRQNAFQIPEHCYECFNIYHCVRECPEICPVVDNPSYQLGDGFRCRIQKQLSEVWIQDFAVNE